MYRFAFVIDTEGFTVSRKYLVKELSVYDFQRDTCSVYHFELPRLYKELSPNDKQCISYVSKRVHGMKFVNHPTDLRERELYGVLTDLVEEANRRGKWICYKGGCYEKQLLEEIGYYNAVNIELFGCPKFEVLVELYNEDVLLNCGKHRKNHNKIMHCSMSEVKLFGRWLNDHCIKADTYIAEQRNKT